jgi:hypothetical protein
MEIYAMAYSNIQAGLFQESKRLLCAAEHAVFGVGKRP